MVLSSFLRNVIKKTNSTKYTNSISNLKFLLIFHKSRYLIRYSNNLEDIYKWHGTFRTHRKLNNIRIQQRVSLLSVPKLATNTCCQKLVVDLTIRPFLSSYKKKSVRYIKIFRYAQGLEKSLIIRVYCTQSYDLYFYRKYFQGLNLWPHDNFTNYSKPLDFIKLIEFRCNFHIFN